VLSRVHSAAATGIDAVPVEIEVDISSGLPTVVMVGLPDAAVRESRDRVKAAVANSGYRFPNRRLTINLAPAEVTKSGPVYDLPIAVAILVATGDVAPESVEGAYLVGELALDGRARRVTGVLPAAIAARDAGAKMMIVPAENAREAAVVEGLRVHGVETLAEAVGVLSGAIDAVPVSVSAEEMLSDRGSYEVDFADVRGQESAKRAITVAAAGGHNILMIGPPGSGKSMMAKRVPTILPRLSLDEAIETTKVHSVAGALTAGDALVTTRPFRSPHHTTSYAGMVGGGRDPVPGEISLAHNGVVFLDELPEFDRQTKEALRQPLEDGHVTISRAAGRVTFPASVTLVAAMNPCPCGYYTDPKRTCRCSAQKIHGYLSRISGPLLDRIDIHVEVLPVQYRQLSSDRVGESSASLLELVDRARDVQAERFRPGGAERAGGAGGAGAGASDDGATSPAPPRTRVFTNARMSEKQIKLFCTPEPAGASLLKQAMTELGFSARAYTRILKVSRTIADMAGAESIAAEHVSEAIAYRALDRGGIF